MTGAAPARPAASSARARHFRVLAGLAAALVLALGVAGYLTWRMNFVPADLDTTTSRPTADGLFQVSYAPSAAPVPVHELHAWTLVVTTPDGRPVEGARIDVDGDMPQHGHGLPTEPRMTRELGDGRYLVEGVKFQMGGWWVMDVKVHAGDRSDHVRFDLLLEN